MASIAIAVSVPTFTGLKAEIRAAPAKVSSNTVVRMAPVVRASASSDALKTVGKALIAASSSLLLVASANAVTVKMGADDGTLGFYPNAISVAAGESITFVNNKGFPHNVVFDEDAVPAGVKVEEINHEEYANALDESFSINLKTPGTYEFYCEPHQGAGMKGQITVS
jgi:plastocyanin